MGNEALILELEKNIQALEQVIIDAASRLKNLEMQLKLKKEEIVHEEKNVDNYN